MPITVSKDESAEIFYNGVSFGFVKDHTTRKYIEPWLPATGKDNIRTLLIKRIKPDLSDEMVIKLLESIWSKLNTSGVLSFDSANNRYLLSTNAITVRTVEKLYKAKRFEIPYKTLNELRGYLTSNFYSDIDINKHGLLYLMVFLQTKED